MKHKKVINKFTVLEERKYLNGIFTELCLTWAMGDPRSKLPSISCFLSFSLIHSCDVIVMMLY